MEYDVQTAIKELANRFYSGPNYASALTILQKHGRAMAPQNINILDNLLTERRKLLDSNEPFFDEAQLVDAIHYSYGMKWPVGTVSRGNQESGYSPSDTVVNRINLEGFVESDDHEPRENE